MLAEGLPVLGEFDSGHIHADHADSEALPDPLLVGFDGQIEGGLAAHGGQHGVNAVFFADTDQAFHVEGKQVDMIGRDRVGHDGGRVAVDEDDLDALFTKGTGGLAAGIVEFTGLADHDGAAADEQDGLDERGEVDDYLDLLLIEERKDEPTVPFEVVEKLLSSGNSSSMTLGQVGILSSDHLIF
jgi:hypothetical protein